MENKDIHILILKSFDELKFNLGKKTLIDYLKGNPNSTISRNELDENDLFGSLYMVDEDLIEFVLDQLIKDNYLQIQEIRGGFKVIARTLKGVREIFERKFILKEKDSIRIKSMFSEETKITEEDKKLFNVFEFFLKKFNDEQKKAIISNKLNILCVAGAGTGKTTVLTKRIEFLKKFKDVKEEEILAITFTKKAKEEMVHRLNNLGIKNTRVETFNSFCEKELKKNGNLIYDKPTRVARFSDKIAIVKWAFSKIGTRFETIVDDYFNKRQLKEKSADELFFVFVNDIFTIIDFYKNLEENLRPFYENESHFRKKRIAKLMYDMVKLIQFELKKRGLRDFSDQIIDALKLFREFPEKIPKFKYLLIDEYQDLNLVQFELIKTLNINSVFAVGDPRQAIYGWRGSDIKFILDFPKNFKDTEIISLKKNYRSNKEIINLFNLVIKPMGFIDLEYGFNNNSKQIESESQKSIFLQEFNSETLERIFIMEAIKNSKNKRNEIFVLARTNKILSKISEVFDQNGIDYVIKSEEEYKNTQEPKENQVVLATVHSIKGMEAKEVYLVSANSLSFPNKVQDNFVLGLVKEDNDYDKYAEELRLFYVALSRAKEKLILTYTGNPTKFISDEAMNLFEIKNKDKNLFQFGSSFQENNSSKKDNKILISMLKEWRSEKAKDGLPLYMIISNRAIEELAKYRPKSKAEMFSINGLGTSKIEKYGDEILKIISD